MKVLLAGVIVLAAMTFAHAQPRDGEVVVVLPSIWDRETSRLIEVLGALASPPEPGKVERELRKRVMKHRRAALNREAAWLLRQSPELREERQRDPDPHVVLNLRKTRGNLHLNGN